MAGKSVAKAAAKMPVPAYGSGGEIILPGGRKLKIVAVVTVPLLKHEPAKDNIVCILITGPIYQGKQIKTKDGKEEVDAKTGQKKAPPFLVPVRDMDDNDRQKDYIVNAVVRSNLEERYAGGGYVGKAFAIIKGPKQPGKDYHQFAITEVSAD